MNARMFALQKCVESIDKQLKILENKNFHRLNKNRIIERHKKLREHVIELFGKMSVLDEYEAEISSNEISFRKDNVLFVVCYDNVSFTLYVDNDNKDKYVEIWGVSLMIDDDKFEFLQKVLSGKMKFDEIVSEYAKFRDNIFYVIFDENETSYKEIYFEGDFLSIHLLENDGKGSYNITEIFFEVENYDEAHIEFIKMFLRNEITFDQLIELLNATKVI